MRILTGFVSGSFRLEPRKGEATMSDNFESTGLLWLRLKVYRQFRNAVVGSQ